MPKILSPAKGLTTYSVTRDPLFPTDQDVYLKMDRWKYARKGRIVIAGYTHPLMKVPGTDYYKPTPVPSYKFQDYYINELNCEVYLLDGTRWETRFTYYGPGRYRIGSGPWIDVSVPEGYPTKADIPF